MYVHEKGARHLVDPTSWSTARPWSTATCSTRSTGGSTPTAGRAGHVLEDGERGRRVVRTARSPPSTRPATPSTTSPCTTSDSGLLFAGDAVGVRLPDVGRAAPGHAAARLRPRPGPHVAAALRRAPAGRASPSPTTAWSPTRPTILEEAEETLTPVGRGGRGGLAGRTATSPTRWRRSSRPTSTASTRRQREKLETLNGIHSNAAGFRRWLEQGHHVHARPITPRHGHGHDGPVGDRPVT